MGYANINDVHAPVVLRQVSSFLEDQGYEAFPFGNSVVRMGTNCGKPVRPGFPRPNVFLHFRIAGFICGLGEIGWSKLFLTPEFGPRQRLQFIITDAPLSADPVYAGPKLCNRCKRCVTQCPVSAISGDESVKVTIAGHELEWGQLDQHRCGLGWQTGAVDQNPFMNPQVKAVMDEVLNDPRPFEARQKDVWEPKNKLMDCHIPTQAGWYYFKHPGAICGGRGCIRECMISLEDRGVLKNRFHEKFRRRPPWRISPADTSRADQDVVAGRRD
jgi:ferredoxin